MEMILLADASETQPAMSQTVSVGSQINCRLRTTSRSLPREPFSSRRRMISANAIARRLLAWVPDEMFTKLQFRYRLGRRLNLRDPQTFNEKLQWLKLRYRDPLMRKCADKLAVRDYVAETAGSELLIPLLGTYRDADEIDVARLPDRFVLKANHGSGWNVLCRDRQHLDWLRTKTKLNKWLRTDFSRIAREWVYAGIEP